MNDPGPWKTSEADVRLPDELVRAVNRGDCVAFVGAGFSAASALPPWSTLLLELARSEGLPDGIRAYVESRLKSKSAHVFDEAAQVLEDAMGRLRLLEELKKWMSHPVITSDMESRLSWLRGIPFRAVLTTNFDGLLSGHLPSSDAFRTVLRPREHEGWWEPRFWREGAVEGAQTVKLHGDLLQTEGRDEIVLTRRDYRRRLYSEPGYAGFLRAVLSTTTVLYLGFSFEDAYLNELRSEVLALIGHEHSSRPVAYALVNDVPPQTVRYFREHEGVEILTYGTGGGQDFSGFDHHLSRLHDRTNPVLRFGRLLKGRRLLWLDPHPENNEEAFSFLTQAARAAGVGGLNLQTVGTVEETLDRLRGPEEFDLILTHWGQGAGRRGTGESVPAAVQLLEAIRTTDIRVPVLVFAAQHEIATRKRIALGLGATDYCTGFGALFRRIESVLEPAPDP